MSGNEKKYTLKPSWKKFLPLYLLCILLIPVFGVGLLLILYVNALHRNSFYQITDDRILIADYGKEPDSLAVANIDSTRVEQSWWDSRAGIGTLIITVENDSREYRLKGLDAPEKLKSILDIAVKNERDRSGFKKEVEDHSPDYAPGTLDPLNELVGMWQQGLISDEDYEREKKKFE